MDLRAQTIGIVTIVLGVVLLAALVVPIVMDARSGTETVYNDENGSYSLGPAVLTYDGAGNHMIDGEAINITSDSNIISVGPNYYIDGRGFKYYHDNMQERYPTGYNSDIAWNFTLRSDNSFTFVYEYGETVTTIEGHTNAAICIHRNNAGQYVLNSAGSTYVNANSSVIGISTNGFISTTYSYYFGTPREVVTMDYYTSSATSTLPGYFALDETDRQGVYTISATYGNAGTATMRIFVPNAYEQPVQLEGTAYDMIDVIPLLIACGLAIAAAALVYRRS